MNVAVTDFAALSEIVQVEAVPLQAPDHPANLEPDLGASVSLTDVPEVNFALQVVPQLMPEGLLVTVPVPAPALSTVSGMGEAVRLKVAVTDFADLRETVQVAALPLQAPDHPANLDPDFEVSVSLTDVPELNFAPQVDPQLMPDGLLVTLPCPVPAFFSVS